MYTLTELSARMNHRAADQMSESEIYWLEYYLQQAPSDIFDLIMWYYYQMRTISKTIDYCTEIAQYKTVSVRYEGYHPVIYKVANMNTLRRILDTEIFLRTRSANFVSRFNFWNVDWETRTVYCRIWGYYGDRRWDNARLYPMRRQEAEQEIMSQRQMIMYTQFQQAKVKPKVVNRYCRFLQWQKREAVPKEKAVKRRRPWEVTDQ